MLYSPTSNIALHVCFLAVTSGPRLVTLTVVAALSRRGSIYHLHIYTETVSCVARERFR